VRKVHITPFKSLKGGGERGRIPEGMNQTGVHCTHIRKCHNKTPVELLYNEHVIKKKKKKTLKKIFLRYQGLNLRPTP
jgi:hypothetical protein